MTFTFTLDAFPDYTKFDQTHKVLASIQVINDVTGEDEGTRQPCEDNEQTKDVELYSSGGDTKAVFSFDDDSNGTNVKITVMGTDVDGKKFDTTTFDEGWTDAKGVEVRVKVDDIIEKEKNYYIIQDNPGLEYVDSLEDEVSPINNASRYRKVKDYSGSDFDDNGYQLLVTDKRGPISVKICEKGTSGNLTVLRTIDVTNNITSFADSE